MVLSGASRALADVPEFPQRADAVFSGVRSGNYAKWGSTASFSVHYSNAAGRLGHVITSRYAYSGSRRNRTAVPRP